MDIFRRMVRSKPMLVVRKIIEGRHGLEFDRWASNLYPNLNPMIERKQATNQSTYCYLPATSPRPPLDDFNHASGTKD